MCGIHSTTIHIFKQIQEGLQNMFNLLYNDFYRDGFSPISGEYHIFPQISKVLIGMVYSFLRIITGASVFQTFDLHQLALKFASSLATTRLLLKSQLVKVLCIYSSAGEYDSNTFCEILKELIKLPFIKVLCRKTYSSRFQNYLSCLLL